MDSTTLALSQSYTNEKKKETIDYVNQQVFKSGNLTTEQIENVDKIPDLNSQLEEMVTQKADKDEVFSMANMGQDIKEAMTGGSVAVVGKNAILTENIVDKQILYNKTDFMEVGKNKFNKNNISPKGHWVNYISGAFESYPTNQYISEYHYSHVIPVIEGQVFTRLHIEQGNIFFDNNMNFVSGVYTGQNFTVPTGAKYLIINVVDEHINTEQLELAQQPTTYEEYSYKLKKYTPRSIPLIALQDIETIIPNEKEKLMYELILPSTVYGCEGIETNVYFDNMIIDNFEKYYMNCQCAIGGQQDERFTSIPSASFNGDILFRLYKNDTDTAIQEKRIGIKISSKNTTSKSIKYLQIGDSTTFNLFNYGYIGSNFNNDSVQVEFLGSQGTGINKCEGYPGKDTSYVFSNNECILVDTGAFNFSSYMNKMGYSAVDIVGLNMGINDMYACQTDEQAIAKANEVIAEWAWMINNIKQYNTNVKIGIFTVIPPAKTQSALNYNSFAQKTYRHKRNIQLLNKKIIEAFDNRQNENIYVVAQNLNLDTVNNFPYQTSQVNARNTKTINRQADGLHPDWCGCWQQADVIYSWIKNII